MIEHPTGSEEFETSPIKNGTRVQREEREEHISLEFDGPMGVNDGEKKAHIDEKDGKETFLSSDDGHDDGEEE